MIAGERTPNEPASSGTAKTSRRFFGTTELDPVQAKYQFAQLVDEVIIQFTQRANARVRIKVDIEAESDAGFELDLQRAVKENCTVLRFKDAEFD